MRPWLGDGRYLHEFDPVEGGPRLRGRCDRPGRPLPGSHEAGAHLLFRGGPLEPLPLHARPLVSWGQRFISRLLGTRQIVLARRRPLDWQARSEGRDWPVDAETMVGWERLSNLQMCITEVLRRGVPGDLIETGVWRGGSTIFMRAVLKAYGDTQRRVWVADSFQGLPRPDPERFQADAGSQFWTATDLAVPLEEVSGTSPSSISSTNR